VNKFVPYAVVGLILVMVYLTYEPVDIPLNDYTKLMKWFNVNNLSITAQFGIVDDEIDWLNTSIITSTSNNSNYSLAYAHKTTEDALNGLVKVNGAGVYSAVTDNSGDWNNAYGHTLLTNNPHSVTKTQVGLSNVENTALSTWAGTSSVITLGTVTTGHWHGDTIDDAELSSNVPLKNTSNIFTNTTYGDYTPAMSIIRNNSAGWAGGNGTGANIFSSFTGTGATGWANVFNKYTPSSTGAWGNTLIYSNSPTDAQYGLRVDYAGTGVAFNVYNSDNEYVMLGYSNSVYGNWFYRNLASSATNAAVVRIYQDNSGDDQWGQTIDQDAAQGALAIGQWGNAPAINIWSSSSGNDIWVDSGAVLTAAGAWTNAPSYSWMKTSLGSEDVLDKFRSLNVQKWKWKDETQCKMQNSMSVGKTETRCENKYLLDSDVHYGAYLDDMSNTFGLDDSGVNVQDWVGIDQLAIKQLIEKTDDMEKRLEISESKLEGICKAHPEISECKS
jgi:hypothetical protein